MEDVTINITEVPEIVTINVVEAVAEGTPIADEKVKYDAGDPTAGYLSAKIKAGTGITLSEGTGADENKLIIDGASTYTLPIATGSVLGGVKVGTRLTIDVNGVLSADVQVPSMVYPSAGIAVSTGSAWDTPVTNNSSNWNTAYGWGNHASAGYLTSVTGEVPLTFSDGLTRTVNAVKNDLITGKAGGQTITGGTAASENLTLQSTSHETIGGINIGTTTKGDNLNVNATLGIELAPALTGNSGDVGGWTLSDVTGYIQPFNNSIDKIGAGTGTITPTGVTNILANRIYKITIIVSSISGSTMTYELGRVRGTVINAPGIYTETLYTRTTDKLLLAPVATTLRISITSISIKLLPTTDGIFNTPLIKTQLIQTSLGVNAININPDGYVAIGPAIADSYWYNYRLNIGGTINSSGYNINGSSNTSFTSTVLKMSNDGVVSVYNTSTGISSALAFFTKNVEAVRIDSSQRVGFKSITSPTAICHLPASTATANTASLKIDPGVVATVPAIGNIENDGDNLHFTINTGTARKAFVLDDGARLTSGRIPIATTNGRLTDDAGHTRVAGVERIGDGTNYTEFETDGTIKFVGTATVFDDLLPTIANANTGGAAPNMTLMGGSGTIRAQEFANLSSAEEYQACWQLPHGWKEGSDIVPHIHLYIPDDGTGGDIVFSMVYTWQNIDNGTMTETTVTSTAITRAANAGINGNAIASFGTIAGTGKTISSLFSARIMRVQAGADTFSASTWLRSSDLHIEKDTIGSRAISTK